MMRRKAGTYFLCILWLAGCASAPVEKGIRHEPVVLDHVAEIVRTNKAGSVVVFDLDDTLFDARSRTLRILKDFSELPEVRTSFPKVVDTLSTAKIELFEYDLDRTFQALGIDDEEAFKAASDFWARNFFSDKYCAHDEALPGAVTYVRRVHRDGARVVYLSGRDVPRMKKGTLESLKKQGFPVGKRTELVLKPDAKDDDFAFKQSAMARIGKMGDVVAVFENEPRNLNLMSETFPKAVLVFLDTRHSKAPDRPTPEAHWVKDYLPAAEAP